MKLIKRYREKIDNKSIEQFNVGYDIPEGMFEVMLKIPIEDLEK